MNITRPTAEGPLQEPARETTAIARQIRTPKPDKQGRVTNAA